MKCPRCGYENPADAQYCGMCSEVLTGESPSVKSTRETPEYLRQRYTKLREQVSIVPDNLHLWIELGETSAKLGQREETIMFLEKALELEPGHPQAVRILKQLCTPKELENIKFLEPERSFAEKGGQQILGGILNFFGYPTKSQGLGIIAGAIILLKIIPGIFTIFPFPLVGPLVSLLFIVITALLLFPYFLSIINSTGLGKDELPDWPDFTFLWEGIIAPFLATLTLLFIPILLCIFFRDFRLPILLISILYYPIALMILAVTEKLLNALNPLLVISSISKIWREYFLGVAGFYTLFVLGMVLAYYFGKIPFIGGIVSTGVWLYISILGMRLIGLIYRAGAKKLAWV